jgi:pteridine reductase
VELKGRVALVTGAGRRIGRAIATGLAQEGARLAVHYHSTGDGAATLVDEIKAAGGDARLFQADLSVAEAAAALVDQVATAFGVLDVLINSAGIMERTPIGTVTPAMWDTLFAINLRAPFFAAQAAAARMGERGGAIVNIADLAGFEAWAAYIPYAITKTGVIQMTRVLANALAPHIRVNAIAPGAVLLPEDWDAAAAQRIIATTPLRRLGSPADVVQGVLYLLHADYVTGHTLVVDGGRHVR